MISNKLNFYLNKVYDSIPQNLKEVFDNILNNATYARVFEKEQTLLVQVKEDFHYQLYAYSLVDGSFKFKVDIPEDYFLMYCVSVKKSDSMGMICKPKDINDKYAIEYAIDKTNGNLSDIRKILSTENINLANSAENTSENSIYPITELYTNKKENSVKWKYNSNQISIKCNENEIIVYCIYHDFEELVLLLTEDKNNKRNVYIYNLDGSFRYKLCMPTNFEISYCPTKLFDYDRNALHIICYNQEISKYDELKYVLVPDNGDLFFAGYQR